MNKSVKGAIAAGGAVALLLGGAGTLAFWTDTGTVVTNSIDSGQLVLAVDVCPADWTLDGVGGTGGDLAGREIVPGDQLTRTCTYTLTAEGDHLEGELNIDQALLTSDLNGLVDELDLTSVFTLNGGAFTNDVVTPGTPVTFTNDVPVTLTVDLTVDFPFGVEDNDSQGLSVVLDDIVVTVTQTDSHA